MKLDILALAAHPDDAELGCGGTLIRHIKAGLKVGVVDLTRGELGTRGTPEQRDEEATAASRIMGLAVRANLGLPDGFFQDSREHQLKVVAAIREYRPEIVVANALYDRHPDHGKGADIAYSSCFLAGLAKVTTHDASGKSQEPWRPKALYHYIQSQFIQPDFVVDISGEWEQKMMAIRAYKSQFHNPESQEPVTYISTPEFLRMLESRAIEMGHAIGVKYGEGFRTRRWIGVNSLTDLI
ncbi:MAG: bacillithiol biosynthesis deacetylase BshB1 [Cyclobacteriaceae bacterium]|nr:bacillithiol biosynthesis deacetylase BshB1 [Cyclobacteriaceae bacterium]